MQDFLPQAAQLAQAVLVPAHNQAMLEARLSGRLEAVEFRLETAEGELLPASCYVTPGQASQISQAIKSVALAIGKRSGQNEFVAIYGELYGKFGITSHKELPARWFQEAIKFLTGRHGALSNDGKGLPF